MSQRLNEISFDNSLTPLQPRSALGYGAPMNHPQLTPMTSCHNVSISCYIAE